MCGRYYVNEEAWAKMREDFPEMPETNPFMHFGDIAPSMKAVSFVSGTETDIEAALPVAEVQKGVRLALLTWGFKQYVNKSMIINARAESLLNKPMFSDSARRRRCVLPASGFYEWDKDKQKVTFTDPDQPVIYLAGIYRQDGAQKRFVIITREANESIIKVHDRMPLIIATDKVRNWLYDDESLETFLTGPLPQLNALREYEQLTLF